MDKLPFKTIAEAWAFYEAHVSHGDKSENSAILMDLQRHAFYSGAATFFDITMHVMDEGDEPTEADLDKMSALHDELDAYVKALLVMTTPRGRG